MNSFPDLDCESDKLDTNYEGIKIFPAKILQVEPGR